MKEESLRALHWNGAIRGVAGHEILHHARFLHQFRCVPMLVYWISLAHYFYVSLPQISVVCLDATLTVERYIRYDNDNVPAIQLTKFLINQGISFLPILQATAFKAKYTVRVVNSQSVVQDQPYGKIQFLSVVYRKAGSDRRSKLQMDNV